MYRFSRAIYRELAPDIKAPCAEDTPACHARVLRACELTIERLATDRHYFAHPARTLFTDVRIHFPVTAQKRVYRVIEGYLKLADEFLSKQPQHGYDINGNPLQCRATTRKGTPCQRTPLAHNGYCPSHQHLADGDTLAGVQVAA